MPRVPPTRALRIAGAATAGALVVALAVSIWAVRESASVTRSVERTATVKSAVAELLQAVVDAESSQRGFLLTGEPRFVEARQTARERVETTLADLRSLASDDSQRREAVEAVERDARRTAAGSDTMPALRHDIAGMNDHEDRLLLEGRTTRARANVVAIVGLVATGFLFGLLAVFGAAARRAAEAENARLAERARTIEFQDRFIAILGHDLRNPLSAVRVGLATARRSAPDELHKTIDRMNASVDRMNRMIQQLLDLARSRLGGGIPVEPARANLEHIVRDVADELRSTHPARALVVESSGDLEGSWDADRLQQVVSNLVGNALSHGAQDQAVRVALRAENGRVVLTVHNGGPPIPSTLREVLFDPFRRGSDQTPRGGTSGLGLGLYISRELVLAHGGNIKLESSEKDGTTFTVSLPRAAAHARG
jgi:signal transduction histidine kinase